MNYTEMRKALRNEIHFIEYPKDVKGIVQIGKNIDYEYCNYCNTILEEGDKLNKTFKRIRQGHVYKYNCKFCFSKI